MNKLTNDESCRIKQQAGDTALEKFNEIIDALDDIPATTVMDNIPSTEAADVAGVVEVINALLVAMKAAGLMESDPEADPEGGAE